MKFAKKIIPLFGLAVVLALALAGCARDADQVGTLNMYVGDPERGAEAITQLECGACHTIPGIDGAESTVAPALSDWGERHYIAGTTTNNPKNLITWIRNPQEVAPNTSCRIEGADQQMAGDIAAYLYAMDRKPNRPAWDIFDLTAPPAPWP